MTSDRDDAPLTQERGVAFAADAMLGKLARWLRMLGFDVLYQPHITDSDLVRRARSQGRKILTRDTELARQKAVRQNALLIKADDIEGQIREFMKAAEFDEGSLRPRCAACNGLQAEVDCKEMLEGIVPDHIYRQHERFMQCRDCGKIYWEGSHFRNFQALIKELRR